MQNIKYKICLYLTVHIMYLTVHIMYLTVHIMYLQCRNNWKKLCRKIIKSSFREYIQHTVGRVWGFLNVTVGGVGSYKGGLGFFFFISEL